MAAAMRAVRALAALALCLFSTLPAAAQRPQTRVALVIANSAYQNATPLPNPVADGRLIAATLKGAGFQSVTLLENQDRIGMERGLRAFAALAERAEVAMLYYAGHGIEYNGENYLIPIDAKLQFDRDLELEAVKLSTMISMSEGASRLRIIVLDACRTPPSGLKKTVASRSLGRGLAPVEPDGDSLVVYSAKAGTTAADGDGGNSPFAKAMARRMLQPGREISLLFRDIRDDVLKATGRAQEPFTYGSLSSQEFYFIDPPRVAAVAAGPIDMEAEAWGLCRGGASRAPCDAYIGQYPQGRFVSLAKTRAADFAAGASITTMASSVRPPAPVRLEAVQQLGVQVQANDDGSAIMVRSVATSGPAFGQLFAGDMIVGINSSGLQRDVSPATQLGGALDTGRIKLLVRRGSTNTVVILRKQ
jgi:hypothetical protein